MKSIYIQTLNGKQAKGKRRGTRCGKSIDLFVKMALVSCAKKYIGFCGNKSEIEESAHVRRTKKKRKGRR